MRVHIETVFDLATGKILSDKFYEYDGPLALADRAAQQQAKTAQNTANSTASGYGATAAGVGSTLIPTLTKEATNPTGFTPEEMNNQLVAGEQGAGGATSGVTGQAGLEAARTRNTGGLSSVLDQAARRKGQTLSQNALGVQNQNAMLKEKQRQAGLSGLEGVYGTDVGAQLKAMGLVPEDINAEVNAGKSGWLQNFNETLGTLEGGAMTGAKIASM
jgi:hypothetical protein